MNRMDNSSQSMAVSEKGRFNCLDESTVLQSSLKMLVTSSLVVDVRSENNIHSQVCNLKFEVVFLLLDFILFDVIHGHELNFLLEENSLYHHTSNSITWNWQTASEQGCCALTESKQVVLLTSGTLV